MNKAELNTKYRHHAKEHLSPTKLEQALVSSIYDALKWAIGSNCLIIGSYARFTSVRPLHDLDVLYIAGKFDPAHLSPQSVLRELRKLIEGGFRNPTKYNLTISEQSHSITLSFSENNEEKLGLDVVPAFTSGLKNEFGDDIYWVPEIVMLGRKKRPSRYDELAKANKPEREWWLKSDPRGYIRATTALNAINTDFRKAAKIIKKWKHNCCDAFPDFKLKSFHVEQALFQIYKRNPQLELADAVFEFFCDLPEIISRPQIRDRADTSKFIDDYLDGLSESEKEKAVQARDHFLIQLENISENSTVVELLQAGTRKRASKTEAYLFDSKIPVFLQPGRSLSITANVLARDGFRAFVLDAIGAINIDRRIAFSARMASTLDYDVLHWKVKNDDSAVEPRGEITPHSTRNNPESTRYNGEHFVECYALKDNVCVARARQNIVLKSAVRAA